MKLSKLPSLAFNYSKNQLWKIENPGKMLTYTCVGGWILGSAAQALAIKFNPNIDEQKKKFLIPQELYDAAGNIGLYCVVTLSFMRFVQRMFDYGRIRFVTVEQALKKAAKNDCKLDKINKRKAVRKAKRALELDPTNPEKISALKTAKEELKRLKSNKIRISDKIKSYFENSKPMLEILKEKVHEDYVTYFAKRQKGAGVLAAVFAGAISSNVLTPYIRNYCAAKKHDKAMQELQDNAATLFHIQMNIQHKTEKSQRFDGFIV